MHYPKPVTESCHGERASIKLTEKEDQDGKRERNVQRNRGQEGQRESDKYGEI